MLPSIERLRSVCKRLVEDLTKRGERRREDGDVEERIGWREVGSYISSVKRRGGGEVRYTSLAKPVEIGTE